MRGGAGVSEFSSHMNPKKKIIKKNSRGVCGGLELVIFLTINPNLKGIFFFGRGGGNVGG